MKLCVFVFLTGCLSLFGYYPNFSDNPHLSSHMKEMIAPHLLPLDHPATSMLHVIFSQPGVTQDVQSLRDAGFSIVSLRARSAVVIAKHPLVPNLIFKIYRNSSPTGRHGIPGWESLTRRCVNAKKMKSIIHKYNIRYFTVPDKWLYPLPVHSSSPHRAGPLVLLLATDMEVVSHEATGIAWKTLVTYRHLDELYIILKSGYGSIYLKGNIPFTKQGTFTLLDLEHSKRKFNLKKVEKYLSREMKDYWQNLIN